MSSPLFKISIIQSILHKSSFNLLSSLSKFLSSSFSVVSQFLSTLVLGSGFGVVKSSRIKNWIKWSEIECVMLPEKVVNSKLLKKILSIRIFNLSVTLVGCRTSGVKKYEHIALQNCELSDSLLIFIKLMLKSPIKKQNLSSLFRFSKSGVKYFGLKSAMGILGCL